MKKTLLLACLAASFNVFAADPAPTPSAPAAPAVQAADNAPAVRASKERGSKMSACRQHAVSQGLREAELKAALAECMKQ